MSCKPSLRIRRSLVWETGRVQHKISSPEFFLSELRFCLDVNVLHNNNDPEQPSEYNIVLKYLDCMPFKTFEVVTLLEDRRHNVQVFCSRLTVSNSMETLFQTSLKTMSKHIPGFEHYGDMTIVCTFSPPAGLVLKTIHGKSFQGMRIRRNLVFEIRNKIDRLLESPEFALHNSSWKLGVLGYSRNSSLECKIYLKDCSGKRSWEPFEVKTFLEDRRCDARIQCSRLLISSTHEILYKGSVDVVHDKLPGLKLYDELLIVCVFDSYTESTLSVKTENDLKSNIECLNIESKGSLFGDNFGSNSLSNQSSASKCSFNFQRLSEDLDCFLEKRILTDVQLRCGNEVIPAHKALLAARSEVFLAMLQSDMVESRSSIIDIKDIQPSILRIFLRYLYSGQLPDVLSEEVVYELYAASDKYAVFSLKKICSNYMSKNIASHNFVEILMLADARNDEELKNAVSDFITEKPLLMNDPNWIKFSKEFPNMAIEIYHKYMEKCIPP